jgi:hypothetical protein
MIKKQDILSHPRNADITFDSPNHKYYYKGTEEFHGVTSWISKYTKPFDRVAVAKKLAKKEGVPVDIITKRWDGATDYGTEVHLAVEKLINDGEYIERPEVWNFLLAMADYELTPILNEWVIYDERVKRASPIDIICTNKANELVVVDMKTMEKPIPVSAYKDQRMIHPLNNLPDSKYYKQALQVNIYAHWLEELYGMKVADTHYVLHLRDSFMKMIPIIDLSHEVKLMYEEK